MNYLKYIVLSVAKFVKTKMMFRFLAWSYRTLEKWHLWPAQPYAWR